MGVTMSLERFVKMFTAAVPDATPEEIADTLWLAASSSAWTGEAGNRPPGDDWPRTTRPPGDPFPAYDEMRSPADLASALADLRRVVPSPGAAVIDERGTAERAARGIRLPVLRSAVEQWLDLALIIDASSSMALWRDTVHDLRAVVETAGVFRHVRVWWLDTGARTGESFLLRNQESPEQAVWHSPWEILDPTRRRVTLVVSDGLGGAWLDQRMARLLERWAGTNHVSVIQLFPQRLWRRCATPIAAVRIRTREPAMENRRFTVRYRQVADPGHGFRHDYGEQPSDLDGVPVPVLRLDRRWLERWVQIVRGTADWADIPVMFTGRRARQPQPGDEADLSPRTRVTRFRATASQEAFQLACYLAFAPLTPSTIRFVQQTMLPSCSSTHLAEVLFGGLLERPPGPASSRDPGDPSVVYEFHPGVRDLLRSTVQRSAGLSVLRRVTWHVTNRSGRPVDILDLLDAHTDEGLTALVQADRHFADLVRRALRGLGGRYADAATGWGACSILSVSAETKDRCSCRAARKPSPTKNNRQRDSDCGQPPQERHFLLLLNPSEETKCPIRRVIAPARSAAAARQPFGSACRRATSISPAAKTSCATFTSGLPGR
jgi:hypothetical protein